MDRWRNGIATAWKAVQPFGAVQVRVLSYPL